MADKKKSLSYRDAGVDIDAANVALAGIKELVKKTYNDQVLCDIGTFGAMYLLDLQNMEEPLLGASGLLLEGGVVDPQDFVLFAERF